MRSIWLLAVLVGAGCGGSPATVDGGDDAAADASPDAATDGVTTVPLAGCSPFFAGEFTVGGSPFRLLIDTGAGTLGVAGAHCTDCTAAGVTPLYTPGPTAIDRHLTGTAVFGGGGLGFSGDIYRDAVSAGPHAGPANVELIDITSQTNFFQEDGCVTYQGILGLDNNFVAGTTSFFTALVAGGIRDELAIRYCTSTGTLWLGGYDHSVATAEPVFTPMASDFAYTVTLDDIAIGGTSIGVPPSTFGPALVDSGGPSLLVPQTAYAPIVAAIAANATFQHEFGGPDWFDGAEGCRASTLSRAELDARLPTFTVTLGTTSPITVEMPATSSYISTSDGPGYTLYCPALFPFTAFVDLGNSVIRSGLVIFDREHGQMGFAPAQPCP